MRLLLYDRVLTLDKMRAIVGVKCFALSEEYHRRHFAKTALVPGVICIEAMAQLLGWLINYSYDFRIYTLMSRVEDVAVPQGLKPGIKTIIHGQILSTNAKDTLGCAHIEAGGKVIASAERILYNHFPQREPAELAAWFRYYSGRTDF
jgi:3-hydroxyacyl-[acyl-carrier-protein] dehydratase